MFSQRHYGKYVLLCKIYNNHLSVLYDLGLLDFTSESQLQQWQAECLSAVRVMLPYPEGRRWRSVCRTGLGSSWDENIPQMHIFIVSPRHAPCEELCLPCVFHRAPGELLLISQRECMDMECLPFHPFHQAQKAEPLFYYNLAFLLFWTLGKLLCSRVELEFLQNSLRYVRYWGKEK